MFCGHDRELVLDTKIAVVLVLFYSSLIVPHKSKHSTCSFTPMCEYKCFPRSCSLNFAIWSKPNLPAGSTTIGWKWKVNFAKISFLRDSSNDTNLCREVLLPVCFWPCQILKRDLCRPLVEFSVNRNTPHSTGGQPAKIKFNLFDWQPWSLHPWGWTLSRMAKFTHCCLTRFDPQAF